MKAMISQPMANVPEDQIEITRLTAEKYLKDLGYEVENTYFKNSWYSSDNLKYIGIENIPMYFLAKSIEYMSKCNVIYFCKGWENTRGCRIEHEIATSYGLEIIYEEPLKYNTYSCV